MELSDLVGIHQLSGVDTGEMIVENDWNEKERCQFVRFTLDGVHYMAVEDPSDGYRSRCRDLVISDDPPRNSFPPQSMECSIRGGDHDILVMTDCSTGDVVLEVGTLDYCDYYPCCHFLYYPEGMACNNPEISDEAFARIVEV